MQHMHTHRRMGTRGTCYSDGNSFLAKLSYLNFHPLEIVSRYRDPQLQVDENYSYLFKLRPHI